MCVCICVCVCVCFCVKAMTDYLDSSAAPPLSLSLSESLPLCPKSRTNAAALCRQACDSSAIAKGALDSVL